MDNSIIFKPAFMYFSKQAFLIYISLVKSIFLYPLWFIIGVSFFTSCVNDMDVVKKINKNPEELNEIGTGVEIVYSDSGKIKAKIIAPELLRNYSEESPYTEFKKGLRAYFYNQLGEIDSKLSANYGKIYNGEQELLVKNDVRVLNTNGDKLNTEELVWQKNTRKITSTKFVKIATQDEIIYGNGMEAKEDFTDYVIKDIHGIISVDSEEFDSDF